MKKSLLFYMLILTFSTMSLTPSYAGEFERRSEIETARAKKAGKANEKQRYLEIRGRFSKAIRQALRLPSNTPVIFRADPYQTNGIPGIKGEFNVNNGEFVCQASQYHYSSDDFSEENGYTTEVAAVLICLDQRGKRVISFGDRKVTNLYCQGRTKAIDIYNICSL